MAGETNQGSYLAMAASILMFGLPVSYIATLGIGLPIYTSLNKWHLLTMYSLSFSGAFSGAIVMLIFIASLGGIEDMDIKEIVNSLLLGFVLGGAVAFTFGRIVGITSQSNPTH